MLFSVNIPETGSYSLRFAGNCSISVHIDEIEYVNMNYKGRWGEPEVTCSLDFVKGQQVELAIRITKEKEDVNFDFGWITPSDYTNTSSEMELLKKAAEADYVIYCGGIDHSFDTESFDKKTMHLPDEQDLIIPKLLKINSNTIIVLTAGSPVTMPWIEKAKAVLWTWYAGMEGGHVLCDILTGEISPSGKMPFTLPKSYGDTPVARYGEYQEGNCKYNEDILVGYRGFEYDNIEPLFAFGHGLSYSDFEYTDLKIRTAEDGLKVTFSVMNTGTVVAKEVVQVYVGDPNCSVKRPIKELRNFTKLMLEPQEKIEVELPVSKLDLSFYDEQTESWKLEGGKFVIYVGSSSKDIRLVGECNYIQ